ncbi:MAG: DNA-3-methyladenine glycosylase I [Promethearchaeota archaeon]|jgi:DNA-3-methyladenine glycosylase I
MVNRCKWANHHELLKVYHDEEWGLPIHDEKSLYECLVLQGNQAGLSWMTILKKRDNYRKAFDNFDYNKIAKYDTEKIEELMNNSGIIRNRLKINSAISNAKALLKVQKEFGSFEKYIWKFTNHKPLINSFKAYSEIPASTEVSEIMSKDLKKRGFKFIGPTICYAFMQAAGMVNDHVTSCFRFKEVNELSKK